MSPFTLFWIGWVLAFGIVEAIAIKRREKGDTLSEQVWTVLKGRPVLWFIGGGFLLWLTGHFLVPTWSGF